VAREQKYFDDVRVGDEMPKVVRTPTRAQLFMYSAISWNVHRIHYDQDYAKSEGHPAVLVHGPLQGALLGQYLTDWSGSDGVLRKIAWSNRGRAFPDEPYVIQGRVAAKRVQGDERLVDCEIWSENQSGERLAVGAATVALPVRG
jgi:hydroxyacyl-ACP dehydratase HTD2-like protein with hotdog domain